MTERPKPASVLIYRPAAELLLAAAGGSRFEATYTRMYLCTRASFARFHRVPRTIEIRAQPISHESRVFKSLSAEGISVRRVITRLNFFFHRLDLLFTNICGLLREIRCQLFQSSYGFVCKLGKNSSLSGRTAVRTYIFC